MKYPMLKISNLCFIFSWAEAVQDNDMIISDGKEAMSINEPFHPEKCKLIIAMYVICVVTVVY